MSKVRLVPMSAHEMLKQQLFSVTETIRFRKSGNRNGTMVPPQLGGVFNQREILTGGHVMRLTELPGGKNNG